MGFISILSLLVAVVYPVIASCRAFEDYTKVTNAVASQNLKLGGFTVPLNYFYKDAKLNENDEQTLQIRLISIQKWFIYWIVFAIVSLVENILFLNQIIPGYSLFKLVFNLWLILPMVSIQNDIDVNSTFDNSIEWKKFTSTGSGLIYFSYIKPWIEQHMETIKKYTNNPMVILQSSIGGLSSIFLKDGTRSSTTTSSSSSSPSEAGSVSSDYTNVLDSFVMVMNMKNKWTGGNPPDTNAGEGPTSITAKTVPVAETTSKDIHTPPRSNEEFDVVDGTDDPNAQVTRRKGFFW